VEGRQRQKRLSNKQSQLFSFIDGSAHGTTTVSFISDTKKNMGIQVSPESDFLQRGTIIANVSVAHHRASREDKNRSRKFSDFPLPRILS
jgi:hypothetical protein